MNLKTFASFLIKTKIIKDGVVVDTKYCKISDLANKIKEGKVSPSKKFENSFEIKTKSEILTVENFYTNYKFKTGKQLKKEFIYETNTSYKELKYLLGGNIAKSLRSSLIFMSQSFLDFLRKFE